jgi:hypothetical protein
MANAGSDALLRIRELCVSACRQTGCNFVLDDVPVRSEKTVLETKNVDDDFQVVELRFPLRYFSKRKSRFRGPDSLCSQAHRMCRNFRDRTWPGENAQRPPLPSAPEMR